MQKPLRFLALSTKHREQLHTEVCPCWTGRCQYLKQRPGHLSLNASLTLPLWNKDGSSWLLAASFQTAEWKPAVQEIKPFISDLRYGFDTRYPKGSLGLHERFQSLEKMMGTVLVWNREGACKLHRGLSSDTLHHHFKHLQVHCVSAGNVSEWNYPI